MTTHANSKWDETFYVRTYKLILSGMSEDKASGALGVNLNTLQAWKRKYPALQEAINQARKDRNAGEKKAGVVEASFHALSPELQHLYERITLCFEGPGEGGGLERMEHLLTESGREARQRLFLYCLFKSNFDVTNACKRVNIGKAELSRWVREDIVFADMMRELEWHKGNFIENALLGLVAEGDTNAVIFASKTFNRDRGYSDKVEHTGEVRHTHLHAHFSVDELDLPLGVRVEILAALRRKKEALEVKPAEGKDALPQARFIERQPVAGPDQPLRSQRPDPQERVPDPLPPPEEGANLGA